MASQHDQALKEVHEEVRQSYTTYDRMHVLCLFRDALEQGRSCHDAILGYVLLYAPEVLWTMTSPKALLQLLITKGLPASSLGMEPPKKDILQDVLRQLTPFAILQHKDQELLQPIQEEIRGLALQIAPNLSKVVGPGIASRLLVKTRGLARLGQLSSAKIQVLGAEKSLHRHKLKHTKPPKYGFLFAHSSVGKGEGKAARQLANEAAIAARIDYFRRGPMMKNHDIA